MIIDLFVLMVLTILLINIHLKFLLYKKKSLKLFENLNENIKFLTYIHKKQEVINLKNTIDLYSQFQILLKISKADYISLFKYDYSNRYVVLHFLLSVNDKGIIIQDSNLKDLPVASSLITLNIMKSDNNDLYSMVLDEVKKKDETVYNVMKKREINKIYYQNIYKEEHNPLGYVAISYKDENFIMPEDDKIEILRIIEKMKTYL